MFRTQMRVDFEEVAITGTHRWKDQATGKQRQCTQRFSQTINPFNVTVAGLPKTREQIMVEIVAQRDLWLSNCREKA